MADIKVDEVEYFVFLNTIKTFIDELKPNILEQDKSKSIINYLDSEFERRDKMRERKMYYDFYVMNRYTKPDEANKAYQKYSELKFELDKKKNK